LPLASRYVAPLEGSFGNIHPPLALALFVQYLLTFFCNCQGVEVIGKVVMVVMPLPFFMLTVLLIYGVTLEGSGEGITQYIAKFEGSQIASGDVWVDAIAQIFFGLSIGVGGMLAYGSNQPRDAKVVQNTWIVAAANSAFSITAGFAVFAILGHLAKVDNRSFEDEDFNNQLAGFQLSFVTFPTAISIMPASHFWAFLFFIMILR
jgi:SNF family Na+-dependent transporter